ncbi:hypothetical protein Hanom_Chr11g01048691 [Helianthus anomalus]
MKTKINKVGINIPRFQKIKKSKLPFWSLRFGNFCYFSPKLKLFSSGSLWFKFYCHFSPKMKSGHTCLIKSCNFVIFLRGKSYFFYKIWYLFIKK